MVKYRPKRRTNQKHYATKPYALSRDNITILQNWFNSHINYPYATEKDRKQLMEMTGLKRSQIQNWLINTRARKWKKGIEIPTTINQDSTSSEHDENQSSDDDDKENNNNLQSETQQFISTDDDDNDLLNIPWLHD